MIVIIVTMILIEKVNTSFNVFFHDFSTNYNYAGGKRNNNNTW